MLAEQRIQAIKEETQNIWQAYLAQGKPTYLRDRIAKVNSRLIDHELRRVIGTSPMPEEELRQEAWFGLLKAVELFEPALGNSFSSYACPKIRGAMLHAIRAWRPDLHKVPQQWFEHISTIRRTHRKLQITFPKLTEAEAAEHLGFTVEYYEEIRIGTGRNPAKDIDDCDWFQHDGINPLEFQQMRYRKQAVQVAIAQLPKQLRAIVLALPPMGTRSIRQLSKEHQLSVAEVEQLTEKATGILKETLAAQGIGIDA